MKIYFVVPDYYANRPKACMNGWGAVFLCVTADGVALPCHEARMLPGLEFPSVRSRGLAWIWRDSPFNRYRGDEWMREPCRSCPERQGLRRLPLPGLSPHRPRPLVPTRSATSLRTTADYRGDRAPRGAPSA